MATKFDIGDTVRLCCGGYKMTISQLKQADGKTMAECTWQRNGEPHSCWYDIRILYDTCWELSAPE
jgi:uncharacterized protein YodC (DUF2158 family)